MAHPHACRSVLVALVLLVGCSNQTAGTRDDGPSVAFVNRLTVPPELQPAGTHQGAPLYRLTMRGANLSVHQSWPPTALWTFNGQYPGPTINVRQNQRIYVQYDNELPAEPPFAWRPDATPVGAHPMTPSSGHTVHLHGADVLSSSDGTPQQGIGEGESVIFQYDNQQRPAMQWYHDHILGNTRRNVYAGLAGLYFIRSDEETALQLPAGDREVPLVLQDRSFSSDGSQLRYYRHWQPLSFGDTPVVNGQVRPYLPVHPVKYRFRLLNASNARFYRLTLSNEQAFTLIGTDGGLLDRPVEIRELTLGPAERADIIVDFSAAAGSHVVLQNNAPAPHPRGAGNTFALPELMQFRVSNERTADSSRVPDVLSDFPRLTPQPGMRERTLVLRDFGNHAGEKVQFQILNPENGENVTASTPGAAGGQFLSDHMNPASPPNALFREPITRGSTEIWSFVNATGDTHPMHVHLVHFQVLDRRLFDAYTYQKTGVLKYLAAAERITDPDDANFDPGMLGWKDTVRVEPGYVVRVIVKFDTPNSGEYMIHCHILEHEDNDMMRAYHVR